MCWSVSEPFNMSMLMVGYDVCWLISGLGGCLCIWGRAVKNIVGLYKSCEEGSHNGNNILTQ